MREKMISSRRWINPTVGHVNTEASYRSELTVALHHVCGARRRALVLLPEEVVAGMCWRRAGGLDVQPEGGGEERRRGEEERRGAVGPRCNTSVDSAAPQYQVQCSPLNSGCVIRVCVCVCVYLWSWCVR